MILIVAGVMVAVVLLAAIMVLRNLTVFHGFGSGRDDASPRSSPSFTDATGVQREYQDTVASFRFPEGYRVPERMLGDEVGSYEKGYGESIATLSWMCAWEKEWLANYATDAVKADEALTELTKLYDTNFFRKYAVKSLQDAIRSDYDKAALGDPSGISNDVAVNCRDTPAR